MAGVALAAGAQVAIGAAAGATAAQIGLSVGLAAVSGFAARGLQPKPAALATVGRDVTLSVAEDASPARLILGEARLGGTRIFSETQPTGVDDEFLYLVYAFADGPVSAFMSYFLNDDELEIRASDGFVTRGKYANLVRVEVRLGTDDQDSPGWFVAETNKWTTEHRGRAVALAFVRIRFNSQGARLFTTEPRFTAVVRGAEVYDWRDQQTRWTNNAALCIAGYETKENWGKLKVEDVDASFAVTAANDCDEEELRSGLDATVTFDPAADPDGYYVYLPDDNTARPITGTRVRLTTSGTLPAGLTPGVDYWWIFVSRNRGRLASSLANARANVAVTFTGDGDGIHDLQALGEPRYLISGIVQGDQDPDVEIQKMLTAMGASMALRVDSGGLIKYRAGVWQASDGALSLDSLRPEGSVSTVLLAGRRQTANRVKGKFRDPHKLGNVDTGPAEIDDAATAEDGEDLWLELDSPYTPSASALQRLFQLELRRNRAPDRVNLACDLSAFGHLPGDTVTLNLDSLGHAEGTWQVKEWTFTTETVGGKPYFACDLELQPVAESFFAWNEADEVPFSSGSLLDVAGSGPTPLAAPEDVEATSDGLPGNERIKVSANEPADERITGYDTQFRLSGTTNWGSFGAHSTYPIWIQGLVQGTLYDVRTRSVGNNLASSWVQVDDVLADGDSTGPEPVTDLKQVAQYLITIVTDGGFGYTAPSQSCDVLGGDATGATRILADVNEQGAVVGQLSVTFTATDYSGDFAATLPPVTGSVSRIASGNARVATDNKWHIKWTNPPDADFDKVEIWIGTANDRATATLQHTTSGPTVAEWQQGGVAADTYYIWLLTFDTGGRAGQWSSGPTQGLEQRVI